MATEVETKPKQRRFVRGVKGLAEYLGLEDQERLVRRWVDEGFIPGYKPGGRVLIFDTAEVDAALEERRRATRPVSPPPKQRTRARRRRAA